MKLAMIGLGKMGGNMTTRLLRAGIQVVGFDRSNDVVNQLAEKEGMIAATGQQERELCTACFTGTYPIELPTADRLGKNLLEREADPAACNPGPDSELDATIRAAEGETAQ